MLYASARPFFPVRLGGAARSSLLLARALGARPDTRCEAVCARGDATFDWNASARDALGIRDVRRGGDDVRVALDGLDVTFVPDVEAALAARLRARDVDVVWASLDGAPGLVRRAQQAGARGLWRLVDAELDEAGLAEAARGGAIITANSPFVAERVRACTGVPCAVTYAPFEPAGGHVPPRGGEITMMNPVPRKGVDTALACVERLPHRRFLIVEVWPLPPPRWDALRARFAPFPNVTLLRCQPSAAPLYARSALLLVPSRWEESLGRVVVEAQAFGVPVIASRRGGLPHAVGDGGLLVDDYAEPAAWVSAIERVLGDATLYAALSEAARRNTRRPEFDAATCAGAFRALCTGEAAG